MATTLSRMTKKAAASSVILPLSNRTSPYHRNYTSAIFPTALKTSTTISSNLSRQVFQRTSIPTYHHFSSLADERSNTSDTIHSLIESEIDDAEHVLDNHKVSEAPGEFPFKIVDNTPGDKRRITLTREYPGGYSASHPMIQETITLTREYQGEEIKVIAYKPHSYRRESEHGYKHCVEEDYQVYQKADQEEKKERNLESQYVYLDVSVSKKSGLTMKFDVTANAASGIKIDSLDVRNSSASFYNYTDFDDFTSYFKPFGNNHDHHGPRFWDMDENLQKAFHTYLEVRGIMKPSIVKFLYDSLANKKREKYPKWLKNMKNCMSN